MVLGAILGIFFFFEMVGIMVMIQFVVLMNVMIVLMVRVIVKKVGEGIFIADLSVLSEIIASGVRVSICFVLIVFCFVGFLFFFMEFVWYCMLVPILGGLFYIFGFILVFVLGIGIGGLLYGVCDSLKFVIVVVFVITCLVEVFFIILLFVMGDNVVLVVLYLVDLGIFGFDGLVIGWVLIFVFVVLPGAIIVGY